MRSVLGILLSVCIILDMTGCVSQAPMKAPCNYAGTDCGQKTKINQWYN